MAEKAESYLQGLLDNQAFEIPTKLANNLHRKIKQKIWGPNTEDANNLYKLALEIKSQNPTNLVEIKVSQDDKLEGFLFSSVNMKTLYNKFKDVILIDTTYRTNRYKMPLVVFGGVNENGKTFILAFGVIQSETAQNMRWIFRNLSDFLETSPGIICTDSCPTLKLVIEEVFPESTHLLCGWHVSQNFKKRLGGLSKNFLYYSDF